MKFQDRKELILLWLASTLPFLLIVLAGEYLYDDVVFIHSNPLLHKVRSLWDCLSYSPQLTKPFTNFVLALSHLLGRGSVTFHRLVSLSCHTAVVTLVYLNLRAWFYLEGDRKIPFVATLLFAIHPLHSESLVISQFRGELLGALFALGGLLVLQRETSRGPLGIRSWSMVLLLSLLASASKEVFVIAIPLAALFLSGRNRSASLRPLFLFHACLLAGLCALFYLDSSEPLRFSYRLNVGSVPFSPFSWWKLASRALVEGIAKIFALDNLSMTRLSTRTSIADGIPEPLLLTAPILWAILTGMSIFHGGRLRIGAALLFPITLFYLSVPNVNAGSEHYWYLPVAGAMVFLTWSCLHFRYTGPIVLSVFALLFCLRLESRSLDFGSRLILANAELELHPESAHNWIEKAAVGLQLGSPTNEVAGYVDEAAKRNPKLPQLPAFRYLIAVRRYDCSTMRSLLGIVLESPIPDETKQKMIEVSKTCL